MCLQDYAIGQATRSAQTDLTGVSADQELIGADPYRCYLIIGQPSAGVIWVTTASVAAAGSGFSVAAGQAPLYLPADAYGNLPGRAWRVLCVGGPASFSIFEGHFSVSRMRQIERELNLSTH